MKVYRQCKKKKIVGLSQTTGFFFVVAAVKNFNGLFPTRT